MTKRAEKVGSEMHHAVSAILRDDYQGNFPSVLITVTEVVVSNDLKNAGIYCSFFSKDENQKEECFLKLKKDIKRIRHKLANKIVIKFMPHISINKDSTLDNAENINRLLRNL
ncbi:MAG: 30S ribosome-binding factor RbfA [Candidatus Marinimicrobia bacterium]|nr:30S ribosome-binding factor RbfA [Candidatus Neomarinimicrobiota bacterium]